MGGDVPLMDGEFKFLIPLAQATEGEGGSLYVEGVATDTGLDLQVERVSVGGQESMARWARTGKVALGGEASHYQIAFDDDLGCLIDGCVTEKGELYLKAHLDTDKPRAVDLHTSLVRGK